MPPSPCASAPLLAGAWADTAPGVTLTNNVSAFNALGGILIEGNPTTNGSSQNTIPFVRVTNNTLYGNGTHSDVGVTIENNASPTLTNNVIANFGTGISIDASSANLTFGGQKLGAGPRLHGLPEQLPREQTQ